MIYLLSILNAQIGKFWNWERSTNFKIGKGVTQGCILSPCFFNLSAEYVMWNARLDNHKVESRLLGEISTSDMQMTSLHIWKWRETKEHLDECKRGEWKSWLKTKHWKILRSWHLFPCFMANRWGKKKKWKLTDFIFLSCKMTVDGDCSHEFKDTCSLEGKIWQT